MRLRAYDRGLDVLGAPTETPVPVDVRVVTSRWTVVALVTGAFASLATLYSVLVRGR